MCVQLTVSDQCDRGMGWPTDPLVISILHAHCTFIVSNLGTMRLRFSPPHEHTQLGILVASYICSAECVEKHGVNINAALKPDGSAVVIAVST